MDPETKVIQITNNQLQDLYSHGKVVIGEYDTAYQIVIEGWDQTDSLTRECRILALDRKDEPLSVTNCLAIPCIKRIREVTGLGLKESKDVFDEWKFQCFKGNIRISRMPLGGN